MEFRPRNVKDFKDRIPFARGLHVKRCNPDPDRKRAHHEVRWHAWGITILQNSRYRAFFSKK